MRSVRAAIGCLGWLLACAGHAGEGWACPAEVEGDGRTPVRIELAVARGTPTLSTPAGTLGAPEPISRGLFRVEFTPPRVASPLEVELRAVAAARPAVACTMRVVPPQEGRARVTSSGPLALEGPADLSIGRTGTALLRVRGAGPPPRLVASEGSVGPWTREPAGWSARYAPPEARYPQAVVIAALDEQGAVIDWLALPLSGVARVEASTEPRASVRFRVGDEVFGPLQTDERGRAAMLIQARPGVSTGTAVATDRLGNVREHAMEISAPRFRRVFAFCPQTRDRVEVVALGPEGAPDPSARLSLVAAGAQATALAPLGGGRFLARLTDRVADGELRISVMREGSKAAVAGCQLPAVAAAAPEGLEEGSAGALSIAPRLGYVANVARMSTALVVIDLELALRKLRWLSLGLESGVAMSSFRALDSTGTEAVTGRAWLLPLVLRATGRAVLGRLGFSVGPSAGMVLVPTFASSARAGDTGALLALPSAGLHAGVELRVGPGRAVAEASWLHGVAPASATGPLDAVLITGGYRFEL